MKCFEVENENKRIDAYLSEKLEDTSRVAIQRLITNGKVLVNGKNIKSSYKVQTGDKIDIYVLVLILAGVVLFVVWKRKK